MHEDEVFELYVVVFSCQVTELSETTRGSGGFGSTGVEQGALQTSSTVANGAKKIKVVGSEPVRAK